MVILKLSAHLEWSFYTLHFMASEADFYILNHLLSDPFSGLAAVILCLSFLPYSISPWGPW